MLQRLTALLHQLKTAGIDAQLGFIPGADGSIAVMVGWPDLDGNLHEVGRHFTAAELEGATESALHEAIEAVCSEVWADVRRQRQARPEVAGAALAEAAGVAL